MTPDLLGQLEMLVGAGLQALIRSQEATEDYFNYHDPKLRYAFLMLMTYHWGPTERFKQQCEEMALKDSDVNVRSTALSCLGSCFVNSDDERIEKLLANVVCNESEHYNCRHAAYSALFGISRVDDEHLPSAELILHLKIPEDVDWNFVYAKLHLAGGAQNQPENGA